MTIEFLSLRTAHEIAIFFGMDYSQLSKIIYKNHRHQYKTFVLSKKGGGHRVVSSPSKRLKQIQRQLKQALEQIYSPKPSVHGFVAKHSIVSNARAHLDRKYIFNLDLEDFFGSIHFGRVRNLLQSEPFNFSAPVATVLAQICVHNGKLPQGAPTSPVISNMIARKLDSQLQVLAHEHRCRYTRYVDDITFSFTCRRARLPEPIVTELTDGKFVVGDKLNEIIEANGFKVNPSKTRLNGSDSRMEVTGLTVNRTPNVRRSFVKQISAMLHAWDKYGYEAAESEYYSKYNQKQRASKSPPSFRNVLRGKLLFLRQVRGIRNPIYTKLAVRYNTLVTEEKYQLEVVETTAPEQEASKSLWVIEGYSSKEPDIPEAQGTAFLLTGFGLATCAHVVGDMKLKSSFDKLVAFKASEVSKKYRITIDKVSWHRDLAVCSFIDHPPSSLSSSVRLTTSPPKPMDGLTIMGYPSYSYGHEHSVYSCKMSKSVTKTMTECFEVDMTLQGGNSGGPAFNNKFEVAGVVANKAHAYGGLNLCIHAHELVQMMKEK